jgi:hypothetical protein
VARRDFGKPPRADEQALRLMKNLNVEARTPESTAKLNGRLQVLQPEEGCRTSTTQRNR